jgi:hypothetical protein
VTLYEVLYDQLHPWAQPYVRFARGQPWISFAGEVLPGSVVVARDPSGTAVGVVSLHGDPTCPLLAPTGVLAGTPRGRAVVTALVSAAVEWAASHAIEELEWEADDPYEDLWLALRPLALDRWDDLVVYGS